MHLRKVSNMKTEMSFDEPLSVDWDGNELTLSDVLGTEPDAVSELLEDDDEKRLLRGIVRRLPEKERQLMVQRFGRLQRVLCTAERFHAGGSDQPY